jgi:hypothetical protein
MKNALEIWFLRQGTRLLKVVNCLLDKVLTILLGTDSPNKDIL